MLPAAINISKWGKYKALRHDAACASFLPESAWLTYDSLSRMLDKYGKVVLKPTHMWGGKGIIFIKRFEDRRYRIQYDEKIEVADSMSQVWSYVSKIRLSPKYLVQRYIPLATVDARPFDIRVMVQRKRGGDWTVTGKLAKIAGSGYQVTNARRSHGKIVPLQNAVLRSSARLETSMESLEHDIEKKALIIARKLGEAFPPLRTAGLDMGLDTSGGVWLIEANFDPLLSMFNRLKDKSMYRTILSYRRK